MGRVSRVASLLALDPDAHLARFFAGLHVHDARPAAHRAIFGIGLPFAAAEIDGKLVGLSAKWALYEGGGAAAMLRHGAESIAGCSRL